MKTQKFSVLDRLRSFRYSGQGVYFFFRNEHNAWIHLAATVIVLLLSWYFYLAPLEWVAILLAIGLVIVAEIINTAIEKVMDHLAPEIHPSIKVIKDLASAAVLVAAIIAAIVGLIVFLPRIV